jgi:hypothetical protein
MDMDSLLLKRIRIFPLLFFYDFITDKRINPIFELFSNILHIF